MATTTAFSTNTKLIPSSDASSRSGLTTNQRNKIYFALLDSLIAEPFSATDEALRVAITDKIARRFKVSRMVVAGIRAQMSRGTYGNLDTLLKTRRAELKKAQSTAQ